MRGTIATHRCQSGEMVLLQELRHVIGEQDWVVHYPYLLLRCDGGKYIKFGRSASWKDCRHDADND